MKKYITLLSDGMRDMKGSIIKISFSVLIVFLCLVTIPVMAASETFDFGNLGEDDTGGAGFKTQGDKFVVSNIFEQDGTTIYPDSSNQGGNQTVIIKAEGGGINKHFTFKDLKIGIYDNNVSNTHFFDVFTITFKDVKGGVLGEHSLQSEVQIPSLFDSTVDISSFSFDSKFPDLGYNDVSTIEITFHMKEPTALGPKEVTFISMTVADISTTVKDPAKILTADTMNNDMDNDIEITFTPDVAFEGAITSVTYSGNTLDSSQYAVTSGKVTLKPSVAGNTYLRTPGTANVVITATGYENSTVTQTINAGTVETLEVITQPDPGAVSGDAFGTQPVVKLKDQYGNDCITGVSATSNVVATSKNGTGSWSIGGTTTKEAVAGTVTFTDLTCTLTTVGNGGITFTSGSKTIDSSTFTIPQNPVSSPTLSSSVPIDGASGFSASGNITLTFNENIVFGTGNIQIIDLDDGSSTVTIDAAAPGAQASISSNTLTLNPTIDLEENTNYAIQLAATSIDDCNGNSYAGIADNTTLNFTVADISAPLLVSNSPLDDATNVNLSENIILNFDNNMVAGTGNITIRKSSDDVAIEQIAINDPKITISCNQVTINPAETLEKGVGYYVEIDATALDDDGGNSYAGISGNGILNFTTVDVVINEVVTDPQQDWSTRGFNGTVDAGAISSGTDEWIELLINSNGINFTGWSLELLDGTNVVGDLSNTGAFDVSQYMGSGSFKNTISGDYLILGNVDGTGAMNDSCLTINLKDPSGVIVDAVVIGGGTGEAPSGNAGSIYNESVQRYSNGLDTDSHSNDFTLGKASLGYANIGPSVTLSTSTATIDEAADVSTITATLSAATSQNVTVTLAVDGSSTADADDYSLSSTSILINAGSLTGTAVLTSAQDTMFENDETVIIDINGVAGGEEAGVQQKTVTINDDDATPTVAFNATSSNGSEALGSANLQVDLSAPSGRTVTVDYTVKGTATGSGSGIDYTLADGTLTIAAGDTNANITIASIVNDLLDENNETVIVTLSSPTNATLGTNTVHTYTINDNDATPTVAFNASSSNGSEALGSADLQVDLSAASGLPVSVDYTVTGTASGSGTDYTLANGTLTIAAGHASDKITIVSIINDLLDEDNETVIVTLSNPTNATLGTNTVHTYTINDNDATPTISINKGLTLIEGIRKSITLTELSADDADTDNASLTYTITSAPSNGHLNNQGMASSSFTQQQLMDGDIYYVHDGSNTISDSFTFKVSDGVPNELTGQTFHITVIPVDDNTPTVPTNEGLTLNEGAIKSITLTELSADDVDTDNSTLTYTITAAPSNGQLENTGDVGTAITSFTQQSLMDGKIQYVHDGTNTTSDSFTFKVSDGVPNELTGQTFSITVIPVDDNTPTVPTNEGLTLNEGATKFITSTELSADDADTDNSTLTYTITAAPSNGQVENTGDVGTAITSFTQQSLMDGKIQYVHNGSNTISDSFTFKVSDGVPNELTGQTFSITVTSVDDDKPTISTNTGLTLNEGATKSITLTELSADDTDTDNATLTYTITVAPSNGQVENTDNAGVAISSFTQQNITDNKIQYVHDGSNTTTDSFTFKVSDGAPNELTGQTFTLNINRAKKSKSSSSRQKSTNSDAEVIVNGTVEKVGTANTTQEGEKTVTTVIINNQKLEKKLNDDVSNPTVTIPVSSKSDVVVGQLNGETIKNLEQRKANLEIKTETATYKLPASQIDINGVSSQIGSKVELKDIKVCVKIAEPSEDTVKVVEDSATKNGYQIVVKPVNFEISCTSGNKTVQVSKFNGYVERTVAIPDGIDPDKITTGIVLNADGTFRHVPTQVIEINGKYFAKINSLTNSTYSVIWNPVEFFDVADHWAKLSINDMGSRMVVTGVGSGNYDPDRSITRAEFAAIVVRAMGLDEGTTESSFSDVKSSDWFNGYVDTATTYELITGYSTTTYGPNDTITREQAMTIIARAMKTTGLIISTTDDETIETLSKYTDGSLVSDYAKEWVVACLKSGVVTGTSNNTLSPKAYVTRAEFAVMVQRLLQQSELI